MDLHNRSILITGASSGIGAELARQLSGRGCRLILVARREELLRELVARLPGGAGRHAWHVCDVARPEAVAELCLRIKAEHAQLDGLVLNAGVGGGFNARAIDLASVRYQFEVNFWGVVSFIAPLLPLLQQGGGFVAAVASMAGYRGMPGSAPYSSAKAALIRFMESLRIDLQGSNIHVAVVAPGFVRTPMTDKNQFHMPFMIGVERAARIILRGLEREKYLIRFPWPMVAALHLGLHLPEWLYLRLMRSRRKPAGARPDVSNT